MADKPTVYLDITQPTAARVDDLIARLTLQEKIGQMMHDAPAIERLNIPAYNWWNECLHGVGRAGIATVFPQAIGLAATWNPVLIGQIATAISDEARAKHHDAIRNGNHGQYFGLTYWSPNINIFRDPRWGRGQETYGEDPYLTTQLAVPFIRGLQGDDPKYLKLVATPKHFAAHSGPESTRHSYDVRVDSHDLWDTYLPAFEACIREAKAASIMSAYTRLNGEPCSSSPTLLKRILREMWGFQGFVVSDCGAIDDIYGGHHAALTAADGSAQAVNAGCDLECGCSYEALTAAVQQGLVTEATIDTSLKRLYSARFRLGMFDPADSFAYGKIPMSVVDSAEHRALALRAARESIILLKNDNKLLPLKPDLKTIAVIGPNADQIDALLGNYQGTPSKAVTPLEGIKSHVSPTTEVLYGLGCTVSGNDSSHFVEAVALANRADVVIYVAGLSQQLEGEEGQQEGLAAGQRSNGDRVGLNMPGVQEELLKALHATGKPVVLVLLNGGMVAINGAKSHIPAIIEAWYPGEEGGNALADVLFGQYNPAGRLPITFYKQTSDLPPFEDYRMQGRTYRYFRGEVLYPFGFGLSFTTFAYSNLTLGTTSYHADDPLTVKVEVQNTGTLAGDEVIQVYLAEGTGGWRLSGFVRTQLVAGESRLVTLSLEPSRFLTVDERGRRILKTGQYKIAVGGCSPTPGYFNGVGTTLMVSLP